MLTDDDLLIEIDFKFLIQLLYNDRFLSFKLILILCINLIIIERQRN